MRVSQSRLIYWLCVILVKYMKYVEYYRCNECGKKWSHEWDTEDFNNDFTCCSDCWHKDPDKGFDFDDITQDEFERDDT